MIKSHTINIPVLLCDFCGSVYLEGSKTQEACLLPAPDCNLKPEDIVLALRPVLNWQDTQIGSVWVRCRVLKISTPADFYGSEQCAPEMVEKRENHRSEGGWIGFKPPFHGHRWLVQVEPLEQPEGRFGPDDQVGHCEEGWVNADSVEPAS